MTKFIALLKHCENAHQRKIAIESPNGVHKSVIILIIFRVNGFGNIFNN